MFNIWPQKKSVDDLIKDVNTTCSGFTWIPEESAKKDALIINLREQQEFLYKENHDLKAVLKSIEEDGTEEHNNAIKLRQENAQLKNGNKNWMSLYQEVVDKNNELLKEVLGLRHLKKENVELMERVNEIDNDVIRDLQDEILVLKNDYAVLKAKFFKERDEYKAEVEKLKKDIEDYVFEKDDEIEKLKAQKHPMYPLHWGGYDKNIIEFVESEFNNEDPIESAYNLLNKAKE